MSPIVTDPSRTPLLSADLDAEHYTRCSHLQHRLANPVLDHVTGLATKKRVYDIGCGDGSITAALASRMLSGTITGIDISPSMIDYATKNFSHSNGTTKIDFRLQNAELFSPSRGDRPDLITSFSAFHWVRSPEKTLRKLYKSIIPGGDLVILTYVHSDYYQFLQNTLIKYYPAYQHVSAYHTMFPAEGYRRVLQGCGMEITEFKIENLIASEDDEQGVKNFIKGWLTSFVPLPLKEHERFLDLAIEESRPYRLSLGDNKVHLPYTKLTIKAKKPNNFDSCCETGCIVS